MFEIKLLDSVTQNQISAGEVIMRPSSVIKELIENSIDANATKISIEMNNGGKSMIKISDNGKGIHPDDMEMTVIRYATSKIEKFDDLMKVTSHGFRGEALSSISSVSRISIKSGYKENITKRIIFSGGDFVSFSDENSIIGTEVLVEGLFFNTPARKKFLKNDNIEYRSCLKVISDIATFNKNISFSVVHNGKKVLDLMMRENWLDRVKDLYSQNLKSLVPISYVTSDIILKGFIAKPEDLQKMRSINLLSINNRIVSDKIVYKALIDGYDGLIVRGLKPSFIISIEILPELIDVNVHPQKKEVKVLFPDMLYKVVREAVNMGINSKFTTTPNLGITVATKCKQNAESDEPFYKNFENEFFTGFAKDNESLCTESNMDIFNNYRIVGQIHNSYILLEMKDELWIVDQHAVHERIMYEKIKKDFEDGEISKQALLIPITYELSLREADIINEHKDIFMSLGFSLDLLDEKTLVVEEVPSFIPVKKIKKDYIYEMISSLLDESNFKQLQNKDIFDDKLKSMACRSAVMFGDRLDYSEIKTLLSGLNRLKIPYCPHGRPSILKFTWSELDKMFKRAL